ncbi:flagellar protein FlgN [Sphingomonas sp.]|uniref:flagellar protein FlgN n=1 Tax=Sphingomonas sp. TaxID=28214 RepID=UPI001DC58BA4|nr:flagellar protein FlgN [Sphingomonas sp.]MBX9795366.1 flagellar protein FlgN [Sphingomonas sp.]
MSRRDALVKVIEALHAEITALKTNDVAALERATQDKLASIDAVAQHDHEPMTADIQALAHKAHKLNETCRIYVNLMSANVRRRLQALAGDAAGSYRPGGAAAGYGGYAVA